MFVYQLTVEGSRKKISYVEKIEKIILTVEGINIKKPPKKGGMFLESNFIMKQTLLMLFQA
jgi:hypothetical protein